MKRSAAEMKFEGTAEEGSVDEKRTSPSSTSNKKRKRNTEQSSDGRLHKEYEAMVARWDPTAPDDQVGDIVERRIPQSLDEIMKQFGFSQRSQYTERISKKEIKEIIKNIVIDCINAPIRKLIYTHLLHFQQLMAVVKRRAQVSTNGNPPKDLAEELRQLDPPGEGEQPFSEFVESLHGIMANVIIQVAGVVENNELLRGNNAFVQAVLNQVTLGRNLKIKICTHLFNEICAFAGEVFYAFFRDDRKLVKTLVNNNIST